MLTQKMRELSINHPKESRKRSRDVEPKIEIIKKSETCKELIHSFYVLPPLLTFAIESKKNKYLTAIHIKFSKSLSYFQKEENFPAFFIKSINLYYDHIGHSLGIFRHDENDPYHLTIPIKKSPFMFMFEIEFEIPKCLYFITLRVVDEALHYTFPIEMIWMITDYVEPQVIISGDIYSSEE